MTSGRKMMPKPISVSLQTALLLLVMISVPVAAYSQGENTCVKCHGSIPGRLGAPVGQWKGSIHAANHVYCNECHGGDANDAAMAMSPERGFIGVPKKIVIPGVCGRCHVGVERDYLASAHGKALDNGGPTCVTCHGNHSVQKASLDLINEKSCGRCHSYSRAAEIKEAMVKTEERISGVERGIGDFKAEGVDTDKLEKGLFAARNRFRSLFHSVETERVKAESAGIGGELQRIEDLLRAFDNDRRAGKLSGAFVVGGALLAALFFHLLRKSYE
jgi:hypothetical protein